jgi:hypothetical protein
MVMMDGDTERGGGIGEDSGAGSAEPGSFSSVGDSGRVAGKAGGTATDWVAAGRAELVAELLCPGLLNAAP